MSFADQKSATGQSETKLIGSRFSDIFLRLSAFGILLIVGYFQYVDSYQFPKWKVFLSGVCMGLPFSLGIFISTLALGKRFKIFTSITIILSAIIRSSLLIPPTASVFVFLIEIYAIWNLFARKQF